MATITPNQRAKVMAARKKLKSFQIDIRDNWDGYTAAQRANLTKRVLLALIRIQLAQMGKLEDIE